jgi:hypothetical protein
MVIRFPFRRNPAVLKDDDLRLESLPSGLNRTDSRRLSAREVEHRERMLRHLEQLARAAQ